MMQRGTLSKEFDASIVMKALGLFTVRKRLA